MASLQILAIKAQMYKNRRGLAIEMRWKYGPQGACTRKSGPGRSHGPTEAEGQGSAGEEFCLLLVRGTTCQLTGGLGYVV